MGYQGRKNNEFVIVISIQYNGISQKSENSGSWCEEGQEYQNGASAQTKPKIGKEMEIFKIMSIGDFNEIAQAQAQLNVKYSGEDLADKTPKAHLISAMMAELGELLESSPRAGDTETGWKWWKPYLENDTNNMKVEAVDIIHFAKSALIVAYGQNLNQLMTDYNACATTYMEEAHQILDETRSTGISYDLMTAMSVFTLSILTAEREEALNTYMFVINALCQYADMEPQEMFDLYMKKNKLNHARVEGGYTESATAYAKIDENGEEDNVQMFKD